MTKKTYVGKNSDGLHCFIEWELEKGKFSASGYVLNRAGNDYCSCGQILDDLLEELPDNEQVQRIHKVWSKWHLNDMVPGSPRQMAAIEEHKLRESYDKYVREVNDHNSSYHNCVRIYKTKIKDNLWNQQHNVDRVFKNFMDSFPAEHKGKVGFYFRYLAADEKVSTFPTYSQDRTKKISIHPTTVDIIRKGPIKPPDWYSYVKHRLSLLGLLVDSEHTVEKELVIDGVKQKIKTGYVYGSKWLKVDLPEDVVAEIESWVEVPLEEKTPIQLLAERWGASLKFLNWDKDVRNRGHYKLILAAGPEFPYFCGSDSDINPESAIACVLRDAYAGRDGFEATMDYLIGEIGYDYNKETKEMAKSLKETFDMLEDAGLWDDEIEELAREL